MIYKNLRDCLTIAVEAAVTYVHQTQASDLQCYHSRPVAQVDCSSLRYNNSANCFSHPGNGSSGFSAMHTWAMASEVPPQICQELCLNNFMLAQLQVTCSMLHGFEHSVTEQQPRQSVVSQCVPTAVIVTGMLRGINSR